MNFLELVLLCMGVVLVLAGRKLYWFVFWSAGFWVGYFVSSTFLDVENKVLLIIISILTGCLTGYLVRFIHKLFVFLFGFVACGLLLPALNIGHIEYVSFTNLIVSGIAGLLTLALFDFALIIISSLTGTFFILEVIHLPDIQERVIGVVIFLIGLGAQSSSSDSGSGGESDQ